MKDGRELAHTVLKRVRSEGAYASLALYSEWSHFQGSGKGVGDCREKGLATELVYGVLRHQRILDHALAQRARRDLSQIDADVLDVLRLAAYQVLFLDRIPNYAAVNHAVETVRRIRGEKVAGFVNAVLRKIEPSLLKERLPKNKVSRLAVEQSLPDALAKYWANQLGLEDARTLAASFLERAPLTIRLNSLKGSQKELLASIHQDGGALAPGKWIDSAFYLTGMVDPFTSSSFKGGLWTAQDEAAQIAAVVLEPQKGETIVDVCAGVGGKSTHLAQLLGNVGQVLSIDQSASKLNLLKEHCQRLGVTICDPIEADLMGERADMTVENLGKKFDVQRVLLDAPCSGLGVLRRHPELKWRLPLERVAELAKVQRRLLTRASQFLREGGILVYCVCTLTEEEGPAQARWFLDEHKDFEYFSWSSGTLKTDAKEGGLRLWPHSHGTDGFFIARFRRR